MENWNWIEVAWTLLAAVGAYFSFNNIRDGIADLKALEPAKGRTLRRQILHIAAVGTTRRDSLRFFIQIINTGIGIMAGQIPSNPNPSIVGQFVGFIFILTSGLLTVSAYYDHADRVHMQELGKLLVAEDDEPSKRK